MNKSIYLLAALFLSVVTSAHAMQPDQPSKVREEREKKDNSSKSLVRCLGDMRQPNSGNTLLHTILIREKRLRNELERCEDGPASNNHVNKFTDGKKFSDGEKKILFAEVGATNPHGYATAVRKSIRTGLLSLLEMGFDVNLVNDHGITPLHIVVELGDLEFAALLLGRGADVNKVDGYGRTPLVIACKQNNNAEMVQMLMGKSSDATMGKVFFEHEYGESDSEDDDAFDLHKGVNECIPNTVAILKYLSKREGEAASSLARLIDTHQQKLADTRATSIQNNNKKITEEKSKKRKRDDNG